MAMRWQARIHGRDRRPELKIHGIAYITAAVAVSLTLSAAALAQPYEDIGTVAGWSILRATEGGGCLMQKLNDDGFLIQMGKTKAGTEFGYIGIYTRDRSVYVLEGETRDVTFDLDGERFYGTANMATLEGGYRGGVAVTDNPDFARALARKYTLTINPESKNRLVIDLTGTLKAMTAIRDCDADNLAKLEIQDDARRALLDASAIATWDRLLADSPRAAAIADNARAALVFPEMTEIGLGIGKEGGTGVLISRADVLGYYRASGISLGVQAGTRYYGYVVMFMSDAALRKFRASEGYDLGVDGSIAILGAGATIEMDTRNLNIDTVGFIFDESGLMAGLAVQGMRIKPLKP
jgi:lipid-binding SYLF domain-containing protein